MPEDWQPSDAHRGLADELRVDFDLELAKFRDHEFAAPKSDADAAFRNWLRSATSSAARTRLGLAKAHGATPYEMEHSAQDAALIVEIRRGAWETPRGVVEVPELEGRALDDWLRAFRRGIGPRYRRVAERVAPGEAANGRPVLVADAVQAVLPRRAQ